MINTRKTNKGITLIALVITIIVLLILAGVTIAMLTGQNGILSRAQDTRGTNAYTSSVEQAKLAYMAVKTEIMTQKVANSSYDATKNAGKLAKIVKQDLAGSEWTISPNGIDETVTGEMIKIVYSNATLKKDSIELRKPAHNGEILFEFILSEQDVELYIDGMGINGGVSPTAGFSEVNREYIDDFGKIVEGYPISGIWRLFYVDNDSAYLIRDSIGKKTLRNIPGFDTSKISELGKNLNSKYTSWDLKTNGESINTNLKGVAAFLYTANWGDYKADFATWAIGAPTLEMFITSYNATHTMKIDCMVESLTSTGYRVGKSESGGNVTSYGWNILGLGYSTGLDNAIYSTINGSWWLASPSAVDSSRMMWVYTNGLGNNGSGSSYSNVWTQSMDVRPVVSIPLSVIRE